MGQLMNNFFSTQFMPHGYCFLWSPEILWLHAGSDALIALAYFIIFGVLVYLVRRRRQLPFYRMFHMFAAFIFACGVTHLFGIWTIWEPVYYLEGFLKLATAALSLVTGLILLPLLPKILALRSPAELEEVNRNLASEIDEHRRTQQALREAHDRLELRVKERTRELEKLNDSLKQQITGRQRTERKLAQTAREFERFAYCVAHDLKAPLRAMRGFSEALLEDYKTGLDDPAQMYLDQINAGAIRMGRLIDDLLTYSQIGRENLNLLPVDLNRLMQQVQKNLLNMIDASGAVIRINDQLPTVTGHWATLEMAFQNLLSNAIKFVLPGVTPGDNSERAYG